MSRPTATTTTGHHGPALPTLAVDTGHHPRATLAKITDAASPLAGRWGQIIPHAARPWAHAVPAGWLVIQLEPHAEGHGGHVVAPAWVCHEISTRGGHGQPLGVAHTATERAARALAYRVPALD